jgi:hypothetical protein
MSSSLNQPSALVDMHEAVSAWFLGPRAENFDLLKELFCGVLDDHAKVRQMYHEQDGVSTSFFCVCWFVPCALRKIILGLHYPIYQGVQNVPSKYRMAQRASQLSQLDHEQVLCPVLLATVYWSHEYGNVRGRSISANILILISILTGLSRRSSGG